MTKHLVLYIIYALKFIFQTGDLRVIARAIRMFPKWWKDYKKPSHSTIACAMPWVNYKAKDFLDTIVNKEMTVFEWGSGGSTLYFAKHCKSIISVEHDAQWYDVVRQKIVDEKITNITYFQISPQAVPVVYYSKSPAYKGCDFKSYVEKINEWPDNFFDLIVVDGRARNFCMALAMQKIKVGAYILLDNSERRYYAKDAVSLCDSSKWEAAVFRAPAPFQHAFTQSSFFKRLS